MSSRRCVVCGSELPADARVDARYCSAGCRQAALRDRAASEAHISVGGVTAPVSSFTASSGSWGEIGRAEIACSLLRGEPHRDPAGRIPLAVSVNGSLLWRGDASSITRSLDSGAVEIHARGLEARLADLHIQNWQSLASGPFCEHAAKASGLTYTSGASVDVRPLGLYAALRSGTSPTALELLLLAAREFRSEFRISVDGELCFGPPASEPRALPARSVRATTYGTIQGRAVLVVRSHDMRGQVLSAGPALADIPAGLPVFLVDAGCRNRSQLEDYADMLRADLASGLVSVEGETEERVSPGDVVSIEGLEKVLRVARISHSFSAGEGLRTRLEALHLPAVPAVANMRAAA